MYKEVIRGVGYVEKLLLENLKKYVENIGGVGTWKDILDEYRKDKIESPEDLIKLLRLAASHLNREYQFFLFTFGKWFVTIGAKDVFKRYIKDYVKFRDFMDSDNAKAFISQTLPWHDGVIEIVKHSDTHYTIYYRSRLRLFSLIKGMYAGISELMGVLVLVRHRAKGIDLTLIDIIVN